MMKTVSIAALVLASATASFAGSLNTTYEAEPVAPVLPVAGSGIGAPAIIGGLVALAAVGALIANDDDNDSAPDHPVED
ncbi:hypothetical protein K3757_00980 [Sulfitobacter sp. S223]|uniref:hypothetical protein n=1 Tax=Sulfitobacter sp. S223 TaxID=2867023 RepID=UPI0021A527B6|nr:hypothetical protein [Sulfitobacter sp. S223]UWR26530.1 hypothetical protein K3757_00980 [Sulfitobacter sp. S223]